MTVTNEDKKAKLHELLEHFSTAMLITHAGEMLRARPMAIAAVDPDSRIWFITAKETAKVHEIAENTRVHLVCQEDRSAGLSISGRASIVENPIKIHEVWDESFKIWFPAGETDPTIALISVIPEEAEYWDNHGLNGVKYVIEAAKAYVSGTTPEISEGMQHGRVKFEP